jgi:SAM-dependent methyltransferase
MTTTTGAGAAGYAAGYYALGRDPAESERLRRQSAELAPEAADLLARAGPPPGGSALDLGCGPSGTLDLLAAAVGPDGRVTGVDADPEHVAMARAHVARLGLGDVVTVIEADARDTGLPGGSFDLVHARTLLVNLAEPGEVVAEMARLARPGGWVAGQEPDLGGQICHPPLAAWDRLAEIFRAAYQRSGADLRTGRRLPELYRAAGLTDIGVTAHASVYPAGHSRRMLLPDLVRSLHPVITASGLAGAAELAEVDAEVRAHLADPRTVVLPHLLFTAWGRRPAADPGRESAARRDRPTA